MSLDDDFVHAYECWAIRPDGVCRLDCSCMCHIDPATGNWRTQGQADDPSQHDQPRPSELDERQRQHLSDMGLLNVVQNDEDPVCGKEGINGMVCIRPPLHKGKCVDVDGTHWSSNVIEGPTLSKIEIIRGTHPAVPPYPPEQVFKGGRRAIPKIYEGGRGPMQFPPLEVKDYYDDFIAVEVTLPGGRVIKITPSGVESNYAPQYSIFEAIQNFEAGKLDMLQMIEIIRQQANKL